MLKKYEKMIYSVLSHKIHTFSLPVMNSNMYVLVSGNKALIIDPCICSECEELLIENGVKDLTVILTHEHYDHISGVNRLREWSDMLPGHGTCTVYASKACAEAILDPFRNLSEYFIAALTKRSKEEIELAKKLFQRNYSCMADVIFAGQMCLDWEKLHLDLIETPGHSPGSICIEIYGKDDPNKLLALVTGDSLVEGNKIITRFPGGNRKAYNDITLPYFQSFPGDTPVLPGHGNISQMKDLELG